MFKSETNRSDVQEKAVISDGVKNERMLSWTSSGKSENGSETVSFGVFILISRQVIPVVYFINVCV